MSKSFNNLSKKKNRIYRVKVALDFSVNVFSVCFVTSGGKNNCKIYNIDYSFYYMYIYLRLTEELRCRWQRGCRQRAFQ